MIFNCCSLSHSQTDSTEKSRNQDKLQRSALRGLLSSTTGVSKCCLRWLNAEILPDPFLNCSFLHPAENPPLWFTPWIASLSEGLLFDPYFVLLHFAMPSQRKRGRWLCAEEQGLSHRTKHEQHHSPPQIPLGPSRWLWFVREEGSMHYECVQQSPYLKETPHINLAAFLFLFHPRHHSV